MFKLILAWRYLRTRFIAIASIVSVTLGVATLIVVNSVMSGFTDEMTKKLHGILSDVDISAPGMGGEISNVEETVKQVEELLGDDLVAATTVVRVHAMVTYHVNGQPRHQPILLFGIDDHSFSSVSDFRPYLTNSIHQQGNVFRLEESGYDPELPNCGWPYRREKFRYEKEVRAEIERMLARQIEDQRVASRVEDAHLMPLPMTGQPVADGQGTDGPETEEAASPGGGFRMAALPDQLPQLPKPDSVPESVVSQKLSDPSIGPLPSLVKDDSWNPPAFDSEAQYREPEHLEEFDPITKSRVGIVLGIGIGKLRAHDPETGEANDVFFLRPGDDIEITVPSSGSQPRPILANCTVTDFYSSKMHEYDSGFAFMPLSELQEMRGMFDPMTGGYTVSSIQLKLRPGADLIATRDKLREAFPVAYFPLVIQTWRDQQAPLLSAVELEITILNVLLFLIIAVAGFGILATFYMIVVEKTKDIGILKSLGAPGSGVMSIFLAYGLSLGMVGAGVGSLLGVAFVWNINEIADLVAYLTGREVFDPSIYYFTEIPTQMSPAMIVGVGIGAMLIAVLSSVLPAIRAARLHPVDALRYE